MKIQFLITGTLSAALLSGCATNTTSHAVTASNGSKVSVDTMFATPQMNNNLNPDPLLREVSPVQSSAGMGLAVLGAVLGGGVKGNVFDKNTYKGTSIDTMREPTARYLAPKAEAKIHDWLEKNGGGYAYQETLYIAATQWSLIYTDMSAKNSNYDLTYRVQFFKRPEGGNAFSANITAECAPPVKTAPLSDWKANNYAKVSEETQKMMDACVLELENQLPRLLKK